MKPGYSTKSQVVDSALPFQHEVDSCVPVGILDAARRSFQTWPTTTVYEDLWDIWWVLRHMTGYV